MGDVQAILPVIRRSDVMECECVAGRSIESILNEVDKTTEAYAGLISHRVCALFGVNVVDDVPLIWMVAADEFQNGASTREIVRIADDYIRASVKKYGVLTNWVCIRNKMAVRFLRFLGARLEKNETMIGGQLFRRFFIGENHVSSIDYWRSGRQWSHERHWRKTGGGS